jgi:hypothetical protein
VSPSGIKRLVFKKIVAGDRRKFEAESNDTPSGGGARDLRFSPYDKFNSIFKRMLPDEVSLQYSGDVSWISCRSKGTITTRKNTFFPPTTSRPNEGRLIQINNNLPTNLIPNIDEGEAILVFIQNESDEVWVFYTTEKSLVNDEWDESVSTFLLEAIRAKRAKNSTAMGFVDFEFKERFYNGKSAS